MTARPDLGPWSRAVADLDGHVHEPALDCQHRRGVDACRVCCPHADDVRVTTPEPADQPDDFGPLLTGVCAVIAFVMIAGLGYSAMRLCVWVGGLL